jgi:hypothetical protein
MNREQVLEYADGYTLARMLEWEYGNRLRDVVCVLIDEEQLLGSWRPATLFHILPEHVERVEFLVSPGQKAGYGKMMLRIYTREFMREMIAREVELRRPVFGENRAQVLAALRLPALCR